MNVPKGAYMPFQFRFVLRASILQPCRRVIVTSTISVWYSLSTPKRLQPSSPRLDVQDSSLPRVLVTALLIAFKICFSSLVSGAVRQRYVFDPSSPGRSCECQQSSSGVPAIRHDVSIGVLYDCRYSCKPHISPKASLEVAIDMMNKATDIEQKCDKLPKRSEFMLGMERGSARRPP
eukprot:scaffold1727_cov198-Alexandrium_tamarense.AAC.11